MSRKSSLARFSSGSTFYKLGSKNSPQELVSKKGHGSADRRFHKRVSQPFIYYKSLKKLSRLLLWITEAGNFCIRALICCWVNADTSHLRDQLSRQQCCLHTSHSNISDVHHVNRFYSSVKQVRCRIVDSTFQGRAKRRGNKGKESSK